MLLNYITGQGLLSTFKLYKIFHPSCWGMNVLLFYFTHYISIKYSNQKNSYHSMAFFVDSRWHYKKLLKWHSRMLLLGIFPPTQTILPSKSLRGEGDLGSLHSLQSTAFLFSQLQFHVHTVNLHLTFSTHFASLDSDYL